MIGCLYAFHQHIIDVNFYVPTYLILEHFVYQSLVYGSSILQPVRHHLVVVQSLVSNEGCLLLICPVHVYLVVSRECIYKDQELMSRC
jgi:hypothetical protein